MKGLTGAREKFSSICSMCITCQFRRSMYVYSQFGTQLGRFVNAILFIFIIFWSSLFKSQMGGYEEVVDYPI